MYVDIRFVAGKLLAKPYNHNMLGGKSMKRIESLINEYKNTGIQNELEQQY